MIITKDNLISTTISLELYIDEVPKIFIGQDNSSGCVYKINNTKQLADILEDYIEVNCIGGNK